MFKPKDLNKFKSIVIFFVSLLISSVILPVSANAHTQIKSDKQIETTTQLSQEDMQKMTPLLEVIDEIPIDLLENGSSKEINDYMIERNVYTKIYNDNIGETEEDIVEGTKIATRANWWKCALSLGQVVVTVGIPASQIVKIKNYIAALGGVKMAAKLLVGATTVSEKLAGTLTALGTILGTLTGVTGVYENCLQ